MVSVKRVEPDFWWACLLLLLAILFNPLIPLSLPFGIWCAFDLLAAQVLLLSLPVICTDYYGYALIKAPQDSTVVAAERCIELGVPFRLRDSELRTYSPYSYVPSDEVQRYLKIQAASVEEDEWISVILAEPYVIEHAHEDAHPHVVYVRQQAGTQTDARLLL